jgi:hypothetical protein
MAGVTLELDSPRGQLGAAEVRDEVADEHVGEDGTEDRGAERAADRSEERRAGGGDAELGVGDGVLHDQDEHLHHAAEPDAEHEHVQAETTRLVPIADLRQQQEPDGDQRGPGDREAR